MNKLSKIQISKWSKKQVLKSNQIKKIRGGSGVSIIIIIPEQPSTPSIVTEDYIDV